MNMLVANDGTTLLRTRERPLLRVVFVGHVDHGKSTLIGRLLHDTGSLPDGKLATLSTASERRGVPFEWSFVLDALQTERDQGITLDTSQVRLRTAGRDIVLIDAPGHAELLRNMVTGAAQADAAMLLIDASEGVRDQTRRHVHLLHLLGVPQIAVVVNKMDRVAFDQTKFAAISAEIELELSRVGLTATTILPAAARSGEGITHHTAALAWHAGPTVLQVLEAFAPARAPATRPLRLPISGCLQIRRSPDRGRAHRKRSIRRRRRGHVAAERREGANRSQLKVGRTPRGRHRAPKPDSRSGSRSIRI